MIYDSIKIHKILIQRRNPALSVTIKEIAEMANVSRATVDKVINNRPGVKKETQEKILAILNEMNYEPNLIGKALVLSKSPIRLGIIVSSE